MVTILSFLGFTAFVAVLTWWKTRSVTLDNEDGYFLGGRSLTAPVIAGSLLLTNLSSEHLIGLNGSAYREGILVMAWETLAVFSLIALAVYFLPRYLRIGLTTIPEYLAARFDAQTRIYVSFLFLVVYVISILPVVLYTGAIALENLFDVSDALAIERETGIWFSVWVIGIIGSAYAIFGGLRAVAISDTINGVGLFIGALTIPILGLMYVGDGDMMAGLREIYQDQPEKFEVIGDEESSLPFSTVFTGMLVAQAFWIANQAVVQRCFAAKSLAEGQKGILLAAAFKLLGPFGVVLPGIIAFHIFGPDLEKPDQAYSMLVGLVLPSFLVGFFAAVVLGAILSTFNSVLNSAATIVSANVYRDIFHKDASEKATVRAGQAASIIMAVAAMIIAPFFGSATEGLYFVLQKITPIMVLPVLSVLFVGLFTKRVPAIAAKAGIGFGCLSYILVTFIIDCEVHFLHILFLLFILNILLMLVIGRYTPLKEQHIFVEKNTGVVDLEPWSGAVPASIAIGITAIAMFALLS